MKPFSKRRGQALLASVVVMGAVALIYIVAVVIRNQSIQKASVLSRKSISAYELANACIQKGIWAINLNSDNWASVGSGAAISGYDGSAVYSDIAGGKYKLNIEAGPGTDDRTITCYAKDESKIPEYRGLKVVLTKGSAQFGAVMGYKVLFKDKRTTKVHWGPIYAYDELDIQNKSRVFYPRLFSKGRIKHIDNKATLPNTDGIRWWSFNQPPGVPSFPKIDFEYYKALAKAQGNYYQKGDRTSNKKHKDDDSDKVDKKDKSDEYKYSNVIDTQPYVRFFDEGVKAQFKGGNNLLRGVIIAMDTIEFKDGAASIASVNTKYASLGLPAYYPRSVSVPADAWKEYKKIDTSSEGDYPADIGGPGISGKSATYTFGAGSTDNLQTTTPIHLEGWIYSGNTLKLKRGNTIVGLLISGNKVTKMESSDSDSEDENDDHYDSDHHAKNTSNSDSDHHNEEPSDLSTHKSHNNDWNAEAHKRRLTVYFQDNLDIHIIGSGQTQKSWQEVPSPAF